MRAQITADQGGGQTVAEAIGLYGKHLTAEGKKQGAETIRRLNAFFDVVLDVPVGDLTPQRCAGLYEAATKRKATRWVGSGEKRKRVDLDKPVSVDTHRGELTHAKTFLAWCLGKRWTRDNPLAAVKGKGVLKKHGKQQLRIDEARRWRDAALVVARAPLKRGKPPEAGAVAALCAIFLGMRATEIISREVRDLDDDGRLLWIPESKTPAGRRTLQVPDEWVDDQGGKHGFPLRPLLVALADKRKATDLLFGADRRGRIHKRGWPLFWVKKICAAAEVPVVSAHSMRGLHSTLATAAGATADLVAMALGHASAAVTRGSYIAPGTVETAQQQRALTVLEGGRSRGPDATGGVSKAVSTGGSG